MSMQIRYEAWLLLLSLLVGGWLMLVYDLFRVLRLMVKHSSFVRGIEDFLFWIFAGVVTFMLLYEQNDGGLRLYAIVGVLVGMSLYDRIVSRFLFAVLKKAGEPGYQPSVSLVLRIQADKLQVVIRDNGVGIEETIKTKVFSPFFTTKPTAEAAGTGLYLSREVVLNQKGTIAIESEKDKYTEVTITLPIYS